MRPSLLAEEANLSWRFYLQGFLIIAIIATILGIAARFLKPPGNPPSSKLIATSVLLPIFGFLILRYATPWGGIDTEPG